MEIFNIQSITIIFEAVITAMMAVVAMRGHNHMYGLVLAFGIYAFYDVSKLYNIVLPDMTVGAIFFTASVGAFYSTWYLLGKMK